MRRGVDPIHLTPKAFELLSTLIEQRPRGVTEAALYQRLWPNAFVDEANLAILVGEIRAALRDSARMPTYIRTGHGFGYAFCGQAFNASPLPAVSPTVGSSC